MKKMYYWLCSTVIYKTFIALSTHFEHVVVKNREVLFDSKNDSPKKHFLYGYATLINEYTHKLAQKYWTIEAKLH